MKQLFKYKFWKLLSYETMDGGGLCPVYLERWTLLKLFGCAIYLHHFLGDDWAIDPHDHPRRFISIGLKGSYMEHTYWKGATYCVKKEDKTFKAPWIRSFPANHLHRITMPKGQRAWTLVIVLPKVKERGWGFVMDGKWIPWQSYVSKEGKSRKSC